jgi:hypothetical protein
MQTVFTNSVRTSQETHYASITKTNQLKLFWEVIAVYCENRTKHMDVLCGQIVKMFEVLTF